MQVLQHQRSVGHSGQVGRALQERGDRPLVDPGAAPVRGLGEVGVLDAVGALVALARALLAVELRPVAGRDLQVVRRGRIAGLPVPALLAHARQERAGRELMQVPLARVHGHAGALRPRASAVERAQRIYEDPLQLDRQRGGVGRRIAARRVEDVHGQQDRSVGKLQQIRVGRLHARVRRQRGVQGGQRPRPAEVVRAADHAPPGGQIVVDHEEGQERVVAQDRERADPRLASGIVRLERGQIEDELAGAPGEPFVGGAQHAPADARPHHEQLAARRPPDRAAQTSARHLRHQLDTPCRQIGDAPAAHHGDSVGSRVGSQIEHASLRPTLHPIDGRAIRHAGATALAIPHGLAGPARSVYDRC